MAKTKKNDAHHRLYWLYYLLWIAISIISFVAAWLVPVSDRWRDLIALPGVVGLFTAIVQGIIQFWRDRLAYEREVAIQQKQQDFTIGIASRMAEETFQKHVEFCQEYLKRAHEILQEIYLDGPQPELYESVKIREQYAAWLTEEIESGLLPFEQNMRQVGTSELLLTKNLTLNQDRQFFADKMATALTELLDRQGEIEGQGSIIKIIGVLREVLGTNQLTTLRNYSLQDAISRIQEKKADDASEFHG